MVQSWSIYDPGMIHESFPTAPKPLLVATRVAVFQSVPLGIGLSRR